MVLTIMLIYFCNVSYFLSIYIGIVLLDHSGVLFVEEEGGSEKRTSCHL